MNDPRDPDAIHRLRGSRTARSGCPIDEASDRRDHPNHPSIAAPERMPWRSPNMNGPMRVALAATAVVASPSAPSISPW